MRATPLDFPTSGPLLRALCEDLDLFAYGDRLDQRTVRRHFAGDRVTADARCTAIRAVADALRAADLAPALLSARDLLGTDRALRAHDCSNAIANLIAVHAAGWDRLVGALRRSAPVAYPRVANAALLRLVAIDLALRVGALLWIVEWPREQVPDLPLTAPNGPADHIRARLRSLGITRDQAAERLGVARQTIDAWLDASKRPNRSNLESLARLLGPENDAAGVAAERRRLAQGYSLLAVLERLALSVRPDDVVDAFEGTRRLLPRVLDFLRASRVDRDTLLPKMRDSVLLGCTSVQTTPWIEHVLKHLWRNESSPVWRTSLRGCADWSGHLMRVAAKLARPSDEERARISEQLGHQISEDGLESISAMAVIDHDELMAAPVAATAHALVRAHGGPDAALDLRIHGAEIGDRDPLRAIELHRAAISHDPTDAEAHFRLGANLGRIRDVETAIAELRIAVALRPAWDMPRVEIAIVMSNAGRNVDAEAVLRQALTELPAESGWVRLHLAFVLEQLDRIDEARAEYERYLRATPRDAEALDRVAHLHLVRGEARLGRERAKEAARHGISTVLDALEAGYYKPNAPTRRPPHGRGVHVHFRPARDRAGGSRA